MLLVVKRGILHSTRLGRILCTRSDADWRGPITDHDLDDCYDTCGDRGDG